MSLAPVGRPDGVTVGDATGAQGFAELLGPTPAELERRRLAEATS